MFLVWVPGLPGPLALHCFHCNWGTIKKIFRKCLLRPAPPRLKRDKIAKKYFFSLKTNLSQFFLNNFFYRIFFILYLWNFFHAFMIYSKRTNYLEVSSWKWKRSYSFKIAHIGKFIPVSEKTYQCQYIAECRASPQRNLIYKW